MLLDKSKLKIGTKLKIWSSKYNSEQIVEIVYLRLNVIFFIYENDEEDWLPSGSYIIEKAEYV